MISSRRNEEEEEDDGRGLQTKKNSWLMIFIS